MLTKPEFDARVQEWKNMDRSSRAAEADALVFYDKHIFPFIKATFSEPGNRPPKVYDGLILTLGFAPAPLILSILGLKPKRVGLLYTQEGEQFLSQIQEETKLTLGQIHLRKVNGTNIVEVYEAIMTFYDDWGHPEHLAADITGGRKPMVSGVTMACAVLGADIYYVDYSEIYAELGNKPEPGSEHLILLDNPYTVFGDLEIERAKNLYNAHDYAGAQRVFRRLKGQVGDANKAKTYEAYGFLCETYEAWDTLDFGKASDSLEQLLKLLEQFSTLSGLAQLHQASARLRKQVGVLQTLRTFRENERLALQAPDGFHFAFMLYHSARRREAQGKLDMACLLLYRLLEWVEQHRLAQYGIRTSNPDYSAFDEVALFGRYGKKRREIFGRLNMFALPTRIGLVDGFLVLHALDDEIVKSLNWLALRSLSEVRNQNIYSHGMTVVSEEKFRAFKATVEEQFGQAQNLAGIDAVPFNQQHEFVTL